MNTFCIENWTRGLPCEAHTLPPSCTRHCSRNHQVLVLIFCTSSNLKRSLWSGPGQAKKEHNANRICHCCSRGLTPFGKGGQRLGMGAHANNLKARDAETRRLLWVLGYPRSPRIAWVTYQSLKCLKITIVEESRRMFISRELSNGVAREQRLEWSMMGGCGIYREKQLWRSWPTVCKDRGSGAVRDLVCLRESEAAIW